ALGAATGFLFVAVPVDIGLLAFAAGAAALAKLNVALTPDEAGHSQHAEQDGVGFHQGFGRSPGHPDAARIQGTWVVTEAEVDGEKRPDLAGQQIVIRGEWLNFGPRYPMSDGGYALDPARSPKHLDLERHNPQFVPPWLTVAFAPMDLPGMAANVAA